MTGAVRYLRTIGLAVQFVIQLWLLKHLAWLRGSRQAKAASALYARQARQFVRFAGRMGGLIIKVGQFMSVRIDLLPKEYIDVLSELQDALPAVPTPDIVAVIESELARPLNRIYASFEPVPVAAASLGQVHRATLPDGTPVAVKVLRPGIEDLVATDLKSLKLVLRLLDKLTGFGRHIDLDALETDFTATFTDELDYVKEGTYAESFQRDLLLNPCVDIPQIYWERSTRRVLTMEYMGGVPIDDLATLDAWGVDRHELAVNLAGLFFEMILEHGRYHADPHPGNVFVRPDGIIQLIDFGMVGAITPEARREYGHLVTALVRRNAPGIVRALKALGFLGPGADTRRLTELIAPYIDTIVGQVAGFYTGTSIMDSVMSGGVHLTVDASTLADIQSFIYTQPIILPGQTTFLGKALVTVIGLCLRLDPGLDLLGTAAPYVTGQTANAVSDLVGRALTQGKDFLADIVPLAGRLGSLVKRLDDGSLEAEYAQLIELKVREATQRQTRQTLRAIAVSTGLLALILGWFHRRR